MAATILVIDTHEIVRRALCQWLRVEFPSACILEAKEYEDATFYLHERLPDLIIINLLVPGTNGVNTTRQISSLQPFIPIVVLTIYEDLEYQTDALNAGARLFIPKRTMYKDLIPGIRLLLAENMVFV